MKKIFACVAAFFLPCLIFASAKKPEWVSNFKKIYPDSVYLGALGSGKTEEAAQADGVAQISRYIKSTVSSDLKTSVREQTVGKTSDSVVFFVDNTEIASNVELFGLEFSESFYDKKKKTWYSAVYFNRSYCWSKMQPVLDVTKEEIHSFYDKSQELPPLQAYSSIRQCEKSCKKLLEQLEIARAVYEGCDKVYEAEKKLYAGLGSDKAKVVSGFSVNIQVENDYNNTVQNALISTLSAMGIKCGSSSEYVYQGFADVEENISQEEDLITLTPTVTFQLVDENGSTTFSFAQNGEAKSAYSMEKARKKAFQPLSDQIKLNVSKKLFESL